MKASVKNELAFPKLEEPGAGRRRELSIEEMRAVGGGGGAILQAASFLISPVTHTSMLDPDFTRQLMEVAVVCDQGKINRPVDYVRVY